MSAGGGDKGGCEDMIENGEIIQLEDEKEFIWIGKVEDAGKTYLLLMSNFKPLGIRIARVCGEDSLEIINNLAEKQHVLGLFGAIEENEQAEVGIRHDTIVGAGNDKGG